MDGKRIVGLMALGLMLGVGSGAAQAGETGAGEGQLVARVVAREDTTQAYALFLPPGHGADRQWPALVVMDPRGRALLPLERFRPAAERLGYVILSSYNTSSDEETSGRDTQRAVEVMVNDVMEPLSLDPRRLYLVGFSGTARISWLIAKQIPDNVAGIIGVGGGFDRTSIGWLLGNDSLSVSYFGAAGTAGFNNVMVRGMDDLLDGSGVRHRVRTFQGGHQWLPERMATEAVEWQEVQAQRAGLAPPDSAWLAERYEAELAAARAREREGRTYDAFLRYRQAAEAFTGVVDAVEARASAERLASTPAVRREEGLVGHWDAWEMEMLRERIQPLLRVFDDERPPSVAELARTLGLDELQELARSGDTLAAGAATRVLARARVSAAFYVPRELLAEGRVGHALPALELAHRIRPAATDICRWWRELPRKLRSTSPVLAQVCFEEGAS